MAQVGTETLIHVKPVRRKLWGYHSMQGWYFAPDIKHYCIIKTVIDTGVVRLTDTFKFKHHAIKNPIFTPVDRIVKSTQALSLTVQGNNDVPPDELESITKIQALVLGNNKNGTTKYKRVEPVNVPTPINNDQTSQ